ncbi:piggyBac transposable element-derived protein 4-like [Tachysurus ichikawai]
MSVQEEVERTQKGGPYKVKAATPTALQVKGKTMWYHLNHCRRVTKVSAKREGGEERPASQNNKVQGLEILGGGVEEGKQENEGNKLVGMSDARHIPDDKSSYSQYPLIQFQPGFPTINFPAFNQTKAATTHSPQPIQTMQKHLIVTSCKRDKCKG